MLTQVSLTRVPSLLEDRSTLRLLALGAAMLLVHRRKPHFPRSLRAHRKDTQCVLRALGSALANHVDKLPNSPRLRCLVGRLRFGGCAGDSEPSPNDDEEWSGSSGVYIRPCESTLAPATRHLRTCSSTPSCCKAMALGSAGTDSCPFLGPVRVRTQMERCK